MKKCRQNRKADSLLESTEDFFIKEHGKSDFLNYPHFLKDEAKGVALLYVNEYKSVKRLERIFKIFTVIDELLPKIGDMDE